jgi:hypothetical protein
MHMPSSLTGFPGQVEIGDKKGRREAGKRVRRGIRMPKILKTREEI